jgi:hypothetical protein
LGWIHNTLLQETLVQPGFEGYQMNNRINRVAQQRRVRSVFDGFRSDIPVLKAGLWIRIDLIRIRIQHFCSIRIRIQAKTELSKTISFSKFLKSKFELNQIKNTGDTGVIHQNIFQKVVSAILYLFSGKIFLKK